MTQRLELVIEIDGKRRTLRDIDDIRRAVGRLGDGAEQATQQFEDIGGGIGELSFAFNNVLQTAQTFFTQLSRGYDLLIGQNERFRQGVLESAATIAANSDISLGGELITDPTAAILALQEPIQEAIREVEIATRSLVGVTEQETNAIFNTILSNSALLAEQSQAFPDSISAAKSLAPGLTAALGTLQVPLAQANQEIRALLQGDIDTNAALANALQISRDDIERARAAGELVDFLRERFTTFEAANALAAQSVGGITSNIQGLIEVASRAAGEPLFEILVEQLSRLEQFLTQNEQTIQRIGIAVGESVGDAIEPIGDALVDEVVPALFEFFEALGQSADGLDDLAQIAGEGVGDLLSLLANVLKLGADNAELLAIAIQALAIRFAALQLTALIGTLQGVAAGFVAVAGGSTAAAASLGATNAGLTLLATSSGVASTGLIGLAGSAAAAAAALLPLVAGFAAVAAAINLTQLVGYTAELRRLNTEVENLGFVNDASQDAAIASAQRTNAAIQNVNQAKASGVAITEEELAQYERLVGVNVQRIAGLNEELQLLQEQRKEAESARGDEGEAIRNDIDARIAGLQQAIGFLTRQNDGLAEAIELEGARGAALQISQVALDDLGTTSEQVTQRLEQALRIATGGVGDTQAVAQAAKEAIELTSQALEQGFISPAEAIANLRSIVEEETLTSDERLAAQQRLTQAQQQENERRLDNNRAAQQQIQQLVADGTLRDIEGQRQLTQLRAQELEQRLQDVQAFIEAEQAAGRGNGQRAQELIRQERELQTQLIQERAAVEQLAREEALQALEREVQNANNLIVEAEQSRQIAIQESLNEGVTSQRQADQQRLDSARRRLVGEISIEQQRVERLRSLPTPNDPEEREAAEQEIRQSIQRTSQLQLALLENERQAQEQLAAEIRQQLEDQITLVQRKAEFTQRAIENESSALQRQNQLISAQQSLVDAQFGLARTEGQIRLDQLNEAGQLQARLAEEEDRGVRRVIEQRLRQLGIRGDEESIGRAIANQEIELARQQVEQFNRQAEARRQQLEIELQLEALAQRRLELETRLALSQAQNQLAQAEAIQDPEERERAVSAASAAVSLAQGSLQEVEKQEAAQENIAELTRRTLETELQREEAQVRANAESAIFAANLRRAEISAGNINDSLSSVRTGTLQSFREGGVPNRGLALVGEDGPELVKFGSTARVFSNPETMRIAQKAITTTGIAPKSLGRSISNTGNNELMKSLARIEKRLAKLPKGVTVNGLNMPQSFSLPRDDKAAAREAARVMRRWEQQLGRLGE